MLADRFFHVPDAVEVLGEDHQIAGTEANRFVAAGDGDLAFQDQARLFLSV